MGESIGFSPLSLKSLGVGAAFPLRVLECSSQCPEFRRPWLWFAHYRSVCIHRALHAQFTCISLFGELNSITDELCDLGEVT